VKTEELTELVEGIRFAMLTTQNMNGGLSSRPLTVQQMDSEGDLWFFINDFSTLAEEVRARREVNATLTKPESSIYVSLVGKAEIIRDREKFEEFWTPSARAFFPKGIDDPELALLHVQIESAELWDSPSTPIIQAWKFAKAIATGRKLEDQGRRQRFEFEAVQT